MPTGAEAAGMRWRGPDAEECAVTESAEVVAILKRMEQAQQKALELQAEQLTLARGQMERTEARIHESLALQKAAVSRQAQAIKVLVPIIIVVLLLIGYLIFFRLRG